MSRYWNCDVTVTCWYVERAYTSDACEHMTSKTQMVRNCERDTLSNKAYPRSTLIYLVQKDNRLCTYDLDTLKRDLVIKPSHSYDVHILAKSDCQ